MELQPNKSVPVHDHHHQRETDPLLLGGSSSGVRRVHSSSSILNLSLEAEADETYDETTYDSFRDDDSYEEGLGGQNKPFPPHSVKSVLRGRITLLFVAFLFGSFNVVLRLLYSLPGPPSASVLSCTRGWIAALCFVPLLPRIRRTAAAEAKASVEVRRTGTTSSDHCGNSGYYSNTRRRCLSGWWVLPPPIFLAALELALWNFGALALLNVGLLLVESARASFLTQTSVVITPLVSSLCGQKVARTVWVGCAAALVGLVLLSDHGGANAGGGGSSLDDDDDYDDMAATEEEETGSSIQSVLSSLSFSAGDMLVLGGALSWSLYIFRLSSIGGKYPEISLQALKTLLIAVMYSAWVLVSAIRCYASGGGWDAVADLWSGWNLWQAWALLTFSAVGTGALADVLQQFGQKMVTASEANVLLCVEPVFTMMLGWLLLGETNSGTEKAGGGMIVLAAVLASR